MRDDEGHDESPPTCSKCNEAMYLLLRLSDPYIMNQSICVFGCNRSACAKDLINKNGDVFEQKFSFGGGGVFDVRRIQYAPDTKENDNIPPPKTNDKSQEHLDLEDNDWGLDDNDWGSDSVDDNIDMEAMVKAVENMTTGNSKKTSNTKKANKTKGISYSSNSFPCFSIDCYPDPTLDNATVGIDEDDVGMDKGGDDKIQQMLSKYMDEEEDSELLVALQGGPSGSGGNGSGGRGERDERLSAEDRAMFAFADRTKRAPLQVLRYAKGGVPMWSVSTKTPHKQAGKDKTKRRMNHADGKNNFFPEIPKCNCGSERVFEFQLMPGLLHALDVDNHAQKQDETNSTKKEKQTLDQIMFNEYENGGMNWGVIAVYTCQKSCSHNSKEFLVVQCSVEGTPEKRVVIDNSNVDEGDEDIGGAR